MDCLFLASLITASLELPSSRPPPISTKPLPSPLLALSPWPVPFERQHFEICSTVYPRRYDRIIRLHITSFSWFGILRHNIILRSHHVHFLSKAEVSRRRKNACYNFIHNPEVLSASSRVSCLMHNITAPLYELPQQLQRQKKLSPKHRAHSKFGCRLSLTYH